MTEETADKFFEDSPHLTDQPIPSNWQLWRNYLEPRGLLTPNTEPCTCWYCSMTDDEVTEYRRRIRRMHGERE